MNLDGVRWFVQKTATATAKQKPSLNPTYADAETKGDWHLNLALTARKAEETHMAKRETLAPSPAEVLQEIHNANEAIKAAVAELDKRIVDFQAYLAKLPGRVETSFDGEHPDFDPRGGPDVSLRLYLTRFGKDWVLMYGTVDHYEEATKEDYSVEVHHASKAPLRIKMALVKMFPDLLSAIVKSQQKMAEEVKAVTAEYDLFAKAANIWDSMTPEEVGRVAAERILKRPVASAAAKSQVGDVIAATAGKPLVATLPPEQVELAKKLIAEARVKAVGPTTHAVARKPEGK